MPPRRVYSESDMMRMQRDAQARVRDMQNRSRKVVEESEKNTVRGGWGTNTGKNAPPPKNSGKKQENTSHTSVPDTDDDTAKNGKTDKDTTLIQDILGAVGIDDDRMLIIGLLLILINSKADNTLILALIYLLI